MWVCMYVYECCYNILQTRLYGSRGWHPYIPQYFKAVSWGNLLAKVLCVTKGKKIIHNIFVFLWILLLLMVMVHKKKVIRHTFSLMYCWYNNNPWDWESSRKKGSEFCCCCCLIIMTIIRSLLIFIFSNLCLWSVNELWVLYRKNKVLW